MSYSKALLSIFFLFLAMSVTAQRKQLSQARDYVKSGSNLDKAEQLTAELLKDSANRTNMKIWITLFDAVRKQYEQGNEKLYLKQQYDTAALFNSTRKMFLILEAMDSVDAMPDKRGNSDPKYRKSHAAYLNTYRPNLFNGGIFFTNKKQYSTAFNFFDSYVDCARQPLFAAYDYNSRDKYLAGAAYWASYCGYKENNPDKALKYMDIAFRDTSKTSFLLQFKSQMLLQKGDTNGYVATLREGFRRYPTFPFFFPRLIDHYIQQGMADSAMVVTDRALAADSANIVYRYTKSTLLLNSGKYAECIEICKGLLARNDSLADVFCNMGLAYFNMAIELDKKLHKSSSEKKLVIENYSKSRPYMERYRQLAPERKDKWAPVLYTIYLNLNMGKEFDEMDKLMKKQQGK